MFPVELSVARIKMESNNQVIKSSEENDQVIKISANQKARNNLILIANASTSDI